MEEWIGRTWRNEGVEGKEGAGGLDVMLLETGIFLAFGPKAGSSAPGCHYVDNWPTMNGALLDFHTLLSLYSNLHSVAFSNPQNVY
jgi:hypothetical protein